MNPIGNLHEVRFPNTYILPSIIYYIFPLIVTIVLVIKAVGFSKFEGVGIFYYFRIKILLLHSLRDEKITQKHRIDLTI